MASERYTMYRPNADKTDVIVQYPLTIADQVYDFEKGQFLDQTLEEIHGHAKNDTEQLHIASVTSIPSNLDGLGFLVKVDGVQSDIPTPILGDSRLEEFMMTVDLISNSANRIVNGLLNHTTINATTVEYTTNTTYGYMGFAVPNNIEKKYLAVTKITNIGTINIGAIRLMLAYRTFTLPGAVNLNGMYLGGSVGLSPGQSHQAVTIFSTNDDPTANKLNHPHVSLGYTSSTNGSNIRFEQRIYDVTNLTNKEINEIDWANLVSNTVLKATFAAKAGTANSIQYRGSSWQGKTWLTIGDSITAPGTYQNLVQESLGFSNVINRGIPGSTILGMMANVTDADIQSADLITIYGALNNFTIGAPRLGTLTDEPTSVMSGNSFLSNLKYVIEYILTRKPTARLVIIGTHNASDPPRRPELYAPINGTDNLGDYVKGMGEVARYYGLPFIDMYGMCGFNAFNLSTYTTDGVHLNLIGYQRISSVISGELQKIEPI